MASSGWGLSTTAAPSRSRRKETDVPDSWDNEEDEEEKDDPSIHARPDPSRALWEEAEKAAPMPIVILSSMGGTSTPPAAAIAPVMRILQRPQATQRAPIAYNTSAKSIAEREAAYTAARNRIFSSSTPSPTATPAPSSSISNAGPSSRNPGRREGLGGGRPSVQTMVDDPLGPSSGTSFRGRGNGIQ